MVQWPALIVHCDWGTAPNKRWMAKAILNDGRYIAHAPVPVGDMTVLTRNHAKPPEPHGSALIGFDFPIGIPAQYAANARIRDFPALLEQLGKEEWKNYFDLCQNRDEISFHRPFYPYNFTPKGSKSPQHLVQSLKLGNANGLLRKCDLPQAQRPAAGALFWTLGPKAPGRGALLGWQYVLQPALREKEIQLWPFHGQLDALLKPGSTVVAETYPTQHYAGIFGALNGSKTRQETRAEAAPNILLWAAKRTGYLELSVQLRDEIHAGFDHGDDAFDAAIGLFGMIDAIQNYSPALEPKDETIRQIEGWILGQPAN